MIMETEFIRLVFMFFCLGFAGWVAESINESITRKRWVNKGFFIGPIIPCQGFGGIGIYFAASPAQQHPLLVFLIGVILGTVVEYITAIFLEKCFKVKCWDYRSYPHTRWCHFQGRVSLTISLFFGVISLAVVYVLWDFFTLIADKLGDRLFIVVAVLFTLFLADVLVSCIRIIRKVRRGGTITGYAVFSENSAK